MSEEHAEAVVPDNNDDDYEEEEDLQRVDEEEEEEDGEAVVVVEAQVVPLDEDTTPTVTTTTTTTTTAKPKKKPSTPSNSSSPKRKKKTNSSSTKKKKYDGVAKERFKAAEARREVLQDTVRSLPFLIGDLDLRSFGRLILEDTHDTKYSNPAFLYPVGFSCDRYAFSPAHGRNIKLRCSILDGKAIKQEQKAKGFPTAQIHDGPLFRIMWGNAIDTDQQQLEFPYDPFLHSPPENQDRSQTNLTNTTHNKQQHVLAPELHMKVKVRMLKENDYSYGTIVHVKEPPTKKKKREITIRYQEGFEETLLFPDPDVTIIGVNLEDTLSADGDILHTTINGRPVETVVGETPIEAWGQVLVKLGMIDEIIMEMGLKALQEAREQGLRDAKKNKKNNKPGKTNATPDTPRMMDGSEKNTDGSEMRVVEGEHNTVETTTADEASSTTPSREPPTEEEISLRDRVENLKKELEELQAINQQAEGELSQSRTNALGLFFCNPFQNKEVFETSQLQNWLALAVKSEKTKMRSTGNRKKVVTATDILDRNDSFYNSQLEPLLEGLPGSEFCHSYVFQKLRLPGSLGRSWKHEALLRNEKDALHRLKKVRENEAKASVEKEKMKKRKRIEEARDAKKRQKLEEDDVKRQARIEERMSKLNVQVNDRLDKEAEFQREKVIVGMVKSWVKEFSRRRRAAELVAAQNVIEEKEAARVQAVGPEGSYVFPGGEKYNEVVLRLWNFLSTFEDFFVSRSYLSEIPSLMQLQTWVDSLRSNTPKRNKAVEAFCSLAVGLCQPLASSLTRTLFASLIALNPALQKEYGATFFNEVNAISKDKEEGEDEEDFSHPDVILPVNWITWREIARLEFISDALGELGNSRTEAAHILRGYRSAGHPNSKEARRLRQAEDFAVAVLRQMLVTPNESSSDQDGSRALIRVPAPSELSAPSVATDALLWTPRQQSGAIGALIVKPEERKAFLQAREDYIEDALNLKEEMEQNAREEDDDDEDMDVDGKTNGDTSTDKDAETPEEGDSDRIGKETQYDDFCADIPDTHELIRRCLAVLRALSSSGPAEPFLYPVDPQTNPGYYDMVLQPMCLREVGERLKKASLEIGPDGDIRGAERVVLEFARNVRMIGKNCLSYSNAGPTVIAAGSELLRIFERLLLHWVLSPPGLLPPLEKLDDEKCVDPHSSDEGATILLCDGCEGKYNIRRLKPPLQEIPRGEWYCPWCVEGRWWGHVDPRIGKSISIDDVVYTVKECTVVHSEGVVEGSLVYKVSSEDGPSKSLSLQQIDEALSNAGINVPPIRCLEAITESPGHSFGIDHGMRETLVPVPINPTVAAAASQVAHSSYVFRDILYASSSLLLMDPDEMTAEEWLRLLLLLIMKCAASDVIQNVASDLETEAAESMNSKLDRLSILTEVKDVLAERERIADGLALATEVAAVEVESGGGDGVPEAVAVEVVGEPIVIDEENPKPDVAPESSDKSLLAKERELRVKATEDAFVSLAIKNDLRSVVASFEEENVLRVVDSSLLQDGDRSVEKIRCRSMTCSFCGTTDTALGSPLVRVPSSSEWHELIPHAIRARRTHLVASINENSEEKVVSLTIRVDGDLLSAESSSVAETGICEFLPRSKDAFQDELKFRSTKGIPFVSGSLSAHEVCAIAAHNARKDQMVQRYRDHQSSLIEKEAGMRCGRSLEIGCDSSGRSYWRFHGDDSLFVRVNAECHEDKQWIRYQDPSRIASVIASLGKAVIVKDLLQFFPQAAVLIKSHDWASNILKDEYPEIFKDHSAGPGGVVTEEPSFKEGEAVIVKSNTNGILWDGVIKGVRQSGESSEYRIAYTGWDSSFSEWIDGSRVMKVDAETREEQAVIYEEVSLSKYGLPRELNFLRAKDYLHARDRLRGNAPLPDFGSVLGSMPSCGSLSQRQLALSKVALLAIEAALPIGCVDATPKGFWRKEHAERWRKLVREADGATILTRCAIVLEDMITQDWMREEVGHIQACLPARWKAVDEASASSVALRVIILDRGINYGTIDRKRFSSKKKR